MKISILLEFLLFIGLIFILLKLINILGFNLNKFIVYAVFIYLFLFLFICIVGWCIVKEISFILYPLIKKLKKKQKEEIKPELKKPKKRKQKIKEIITYTATTETKGELFKRLGIKKEKIKKVMELKEIERLEPKIYEPHPRDLNPYVEQLNKKGYVEVSDNTHLGKIRGYDVLIYLRKELKKQGIKTKKTRRKLIKC